MRATTRYRMDVVKRRFNGFEVVAAVNTPAPAVPHRGALERALMVPVEPGNPQYESAAMPDTPL